MTVEVAATRAERPRRLGYRYVTVSALIIVAAFTWAAIQLQTSPIWPWTGMMLAVASAITTACACRHAARASTDEMVRRFWSRLTGATGVIASGIIISAADSVGVPYVKYLTSATGGLGVIVLGWALMALPFTRRSRHEWLAFTLDTCTVMAAVGLYAWDLSHRFGLVHNDRISVSSLIWLALLGAFGMLTVVRVGLAPPSPVRRLTLSLLGLGVLAAVAVSGVGAALIDQRELTGRGQLPAPAAALFWTIAVTVHLRSQGQPPRPRRHSARLPFNLLPYLSAAAVGSLVMLVGEPLSPSQKVVIHGAVLFVVLVLARQIVASYDNARLLRQVDAGTLQLRHREERFRSMVQQAADIIVITSPDGVIHYASPALRQLVGLPGDGVGARIGHFVHPDDLPVLTQHAAQVATVPAGSATYRARAATSDGSWRWLEIISTNLLADPSVRGIVSNARDITDMLHAQEQLAHQATHDELTALPNRALLKVRVQAALASGADACAGVALVDLDDFKAINDRLGHEVGDALLVSVGKRLSNCVRADDTVARLGGDEFAVVLSGASPQDATDALDRIMAAFDAPIVAAGYDLLVQASIGLANGVPGDDPTELLRRADVALYAAKELGKGRHSCYEPGMDQRSAQHAQIGAELRQAMDAGDQLFLLYQPIVGLPSGKISGVEALVRWRHPERGLVSPLDFIPLAERTGLIIPLGRWILREACAQAARWADLPETAELTVSVNVSARQLRDPGFPDDLATVLAETGLNPARLTVEVTETAVFDSGVAVEALRTIHELGVRVALDDFGTGHSSLGLLRSCPVDILKVDKSFVDGVTGTAEQAAIAISLIQITSTMRLAAVAEGVETAEQANVLHRLGYRFAQGFHFARPLPSQEVVELLRSAVEPEHAAT